ncbi:Uncharacterised protein [Mycobacterium tuberculosis]|nr:Uncharacterised protein [Mycobacterium tuberculosis]
MEMRQRAYGAVRGCARGRHVVGTPGLVFRTATWADLRRIAATGSDPQAQRWLGWRRASVLAEDERERLLAVSAGRGRGRFGLPSPRVETRLIAIDPERGTTAGAVSPTPLSDEVCEMGGHLAPAWFANVEPDPTRCPSGW